MESLPLHAEGSLAHQAPGRGYYRVGRQGRRRGKVVVRVVDDQRGHGKGYLVLGRAGIVLDYVRERRGRCRVCERRGAWERWEVGGDRSTVGRTVGQGNRVGQGDDLCHRVCHSILNFKSCDRPEKISHHHSILNFKSRDRPEKLRGGQSLPSARPESVGGSPPSVCLDYFLPGTP